MTDDRVDWENVGLNHRGTAAESCTERIKTQQALKNYCISVNLCVLPVSVVPVFLKDAMKN